MAEQLLSLPKDGPAFKYEQLAYIESADDMINRTYAYIAYKEIKTDGTWRIKVVGSVTAGGMFDPKAIEAASAKAQGEGKEYFTWGFRFPPTEGDPRVAETRVFQKDGKPTRVEIHLITRNADGSPKEEKAAKFDWPS